MTLGNLITSIFRPCSSAPKSPTPPSSPNSESNNASTQPRQDGEVTPCKDVSNTAHAPSSPSAGKIGVTNQSAAVDNKAIAENSDTTLVTSPGTRPVTVTELSEDECDQLIVDTFGFDVLHQLQGKAWDERGQAVQAARARIAQGNFSDKPAIKFFHAGCCVALVALKDKVMPVFFDGLDLAKLLLSEENRSKHSLTKEDLKGEADKLVPVIVAKTSDRNARSIEGTRQALVFLARQPNIGCQQVVAHILTPVANTKDVAAIRGRLELVGHIIDEFGLGKASGLSLSTVMGFVRPHLDATDEKVRRAAVEVTVSCYRLKGERTMKYCSNLKPALQRLLEQRFAELDKSSSKHSSKKHQALPEVRSARRKTPVRSSSGGSQQSSSSGSMGSRGKPLAPLDVSPGGRLPNQMGSREGLEAIIQDKTTDIFAPVYNDVLSSPTIDSSAQYGIAVDPIGHPSLVAHEDPNYIPSPTDNVTAPLSDPFSDMDEAFMTEIEAAL